MDQSKLRELAIQLFDLKALKFYVCKTKAGTKSYIYYDYEVIISNPDIMSTVSDLLTECMKLNMVDMEVHLCGASYMALPVASLMSAETKKPILIRKDYKTSGMEKAIEGKFSTGSKSLIIADVVTSGISVVGTAKALRAEGLVVQDAIAIVDQEQGGRKNAEKYGIRMHSLLTLSFLLNTLRDAGRINESTALAVSKYAEATQLRLDLDKRDATTLEIPDDKDSEPCSAFEYIPYFVIVVCSIVWICLCYRWRMINDQEHI
ncbi:uridine 5'-monophosphate synthase-like [Sabethes cyaneus]|uniref:uridine 5'-monophosphate synthase-like n=1 Tax=Sabethes cyaneus TaxID=53552 RepID=UPI00237DD6D7|nr:uridine 5'-monophosphate synthase-like [Sabethes cyaneus]